MYSKLTSKVRANRIISSPFPVCQGVWQAASVASSIVYKEYLDELLEIGTLELPTAVPQHVLTTLFC